jgi:hypothetical protein
LRLRFLFMSKLRKKDKGATALVITKASGAPKKKSLEMKKSSMATVRSFFFSPSFNVLALVILLVAVYGGMRLFSARQNAAQIAFVERTTFDASETANEENRSYPAPEIFRGEVYDTSIRLRETGALGMAISLAIFAEFSEKKNIPANLETVFAAVQARGLMPPEMKLQNGDLASPSSLFFIRYRPQPLAFEILSNPKQNTGGKSPALLMRFPLTSLDKRTITYFQSSLSKRVETPEPFAPFERIAAVGWTIEQWRGELLPKNTGDAARILAEVKQLLGEGANNQ